MKRPAKLPLLLAMALVTASASRLLAQDPPEARSTYFRSLHGGFKIGQGHAGYILMVEVVKKPQRKLYTRAILQNPLAPLSPFIYEHFIDDETGPITLAHVPVLGLEIGKTYTVELVLYQDEDRKQEIDRLTQPVRSYVDTRGLILKLADELVPEGYPARQVPERWKFTFDSRDWQLGHQDGNDVTALREYVLQGETVENWSELVTSHLQLTDMTMRAFLDEFRSQMAQGCPSLHLEIIEESATDALLEWRHKECRGYPPQHELKRFIRVERGLLILSYVMKTERLPDEKRNTWIAILRAATPNGG